MSKCRRRVKLRYFKLHCNMRRPIILHIHIRLYKSVNSIRKELQLSIFLVLTLVFKELKREGKKTIADDTF